MATVLSITTFSNSTQEALIELIGVTDQTISNFILSETAIKITNIDTNTSNYVLNVNCPPS